MAVKTRSRRRQQNGINLILSVLVVLILLAVIGVSGFSLYRKLQAGEARKVELQEEIAAEERRAEEIEEYREYTQSDEFVREIARQKLGLVYEGEVVFKEEGSQ
ncbi:MAG: septum formation initiator family protein [Lachnospiraceae bacterium]|nr:septum formation initiator family protein [Lachnospiraceae bacterium]